MQSFILFLLAALVGTSSTFARHPDVILLMTDQHRYDELSALGTPGAETPAIDLLASTGFMFTHSFVPTPQCSPTRAAILTGRFPHRTGVVSNVGPPLAALSAPLDPSIPGLGSVFAKAGYQTAYFGKWHLAARGESR